MRGLVVAAVGVCLLAGCAAAPDPSPPQGVSVEEAEQRVLDRNEFWWFLIGPQGAPMPEVESIAYSTDDEKALECFSQSTGIPSITYQGQVGYWIGPNGEPLSDAQNRALFVCTLQYPLDVSDPAAIGMFSEEERAWAWNYQRTRLVPCLQLIKVGWDPSLGARPLRRAVQHEVEDALSEKILHGELNAGDHVHVDWIDNEFVFTTSRQAGLPEKEPEAVEA